MAKQTQSTYRERMLVGGGSLALGGFAVWVRWQELSSSNQLVQAGVPVSAFLGGAAVLGLIASLIIFRTPHDGSTEL